MSLQQITIPDIGGSESVDVIELCVSIGDQVEQEDSLLVLETDKATMDIPSPVTGKIITLRVQVGDKVSEGTLIAEIDVDGSTDATNNSSSKADSPDESISIVSQQDVSTAKESSKTQLHMTSSAETVIEIITLPDLGGAEDIPVIELCVNEGDEVEQEDSLLVLESDKATMEIPSPVPGTLNKFLVKVGDAISQGSPIAEVLVRTVDQTTPIPVQDNRSVGASTKTLVNTQENVVKKVVEPLAPSTPQSTQVQTTPSQKVHAGPAVRRLARELGIDLAKVSASGPKNRILKDDVKVYVKEQLAQKQKNAGVLNVPSIPAVDFSRFGEIERVKMSRLRQIAANNLHRSWVTVPHVTQFDEADITDLDTFRKFQGRFAEQKGLKLTILPFLIKAIASALNQFPNFNVSLDPQGDHLIHKKYVHIGFAVDTPDGLLVPVIRDVNKKGVWELAQEISDLAKKAQASKLTPAEMQGGCFTISSLGGIGGTAFTPIVNTPEVAILGVSKVQIKPIYDDEKWVPRKMLPLSLSYDHRAINGADAARFTAYLADILSDMRQALM